MKAQKNQQRKRKSDRYRDPQQRFAKPQTRLYTIRAIYVQKTTKARTCLEVVGVVFRTVVAFY